MAPVVAIASSASAARPPRVAGTSSDTGRDPVVVGAGAGPSPFRTKVSFAFAVLKIGCFEAGSQSVIVSSLPAVPYPSGSCPPLESQ